MYMPKILKSTKDKGWKDFMEIIIYGVIFAIGTVFGSFFTLAVYRIPLGLDITHEHSFCPNCNTKLKFNDLIPILSYISLGGKCRYCGQKIRIRYLLLEVLSGLVFLLLALSLKLDLYNFSVSNGLYFLFLALYIVTLFIIAGIDKERISIQKSVLLFGVILEVCFMIYVCISKRRSYIYIYHMFNCKYSITHIRYILVKENTKTKLYNEYSYTLHMYDSVYR